MLPSGLKAVSKILVYQQSLNKCCFKLCIRG